MPKTLSFVDKKNLLCQNTETKYYGSKPTIWPMSSDPLDQRHFSLQASTSYLPALQEMAPLPTPIHTT